MSSNKFYPAGQVIVYKEGDRIKRISARQHNISSVRGIVLIYGTFTLYGFKIPTQAAILESQILYRFTVHYPEPTAELMLPTP